MYPDVEDQVVDLYDRLFDKIFSEPFRSRIAGRLKRDAVIRQVQEAAGAASQSLIRFFLNEQLSKEQVANLLSGFENLGGLLSLEDIRNPNVTPETIVEGLLTKLPCPQTVRQAGHDPVYRVGLHSLVQVLMLVGPVMAEWQKLSFSSTFELPRRVVNRLNQISEQLDALGRSGQTAADERYELSYGDYLLQRFHRVEAGTVRMTTNLDVDLRELFVMPRVLARSPAKKGDEGKEADTTALMDLAAARVFFGSHGGKTSRSDASEKEREGAPAIEQVMRYPRNLIVGAPGSGKSTFLEWLQVKLASVEQELVMAGKQAIPLLLRVRQLDVRNLPRGAELIEKATASRDRAALMPPGWIEREMKNGHVFVMLDGLDETEPELRDRYVIPWLRELCQTYPNCRYLVSSRPVGYPPGVLRGLEFAECDLLDFNEAEITLYCQHWCTAVRLARNEPDQEARREGLADGKRIVDGFEGHPYIRNLARNPLMLSAICLVNYFEGGTLPKDRALLYKLCVEGLLHHWDQRRGIRSEFALDEKLRVCREVALAMQADDRAEYEAEKVAKIFTEVLDVSERAGKLLEHIRYRTGLLLERRAGIFAFAHLTFQEYLAALAVHEGNQLGVGVERLVREHGDGRWNEVIPLYCGLAPTPAARDLIEQLISQEDTDTFSAVLADAYLLAGPDLWRDQHLRRKVLERLAMAPANDVLGRFPENEVAPLANSFLGKTRSSFDPSESFTWLNNHPGMLDRPALISRLRDRSKLSPVQTAELNWLVHAYAPDRVLAELASNPNLYLAPGPGFERTRGEI